MTTKLNNPKKFAFVFAGIIVENLAEDGIKISRETEPFTDSVSLTGEVTREQTNDDRATIEVAIPRSDTVANAALSAVHNADKLSGNGSGIAPLSVRNELGGDVHTAPEAWIMAPPDPEYSAATSVNVWKFRCANLVSHFGG